MKELNAKGARWLWLLSIVFGLLAATQPAFAIPSFARKYETSCQTCHVAFPKLNAFGRAFMANGYRFPGEQDPEMVKQERTQLGAEAYKKVFPNAVWPADMARYTPISMVMINRTNILSSKTPRTEFEYPHELEIFAADTIGDKFSYLAEIEVDEGELDFNGHLQYDVSPNFHFRIGGIDPFPEEFADSRRMTAAHYNYTDIRGKSGGFRLRDGSGGLEVLGAINGPGNIGGFRYRLGVVNGNGRTDTNNAKDYFAGVDYKIGGMGVAGGAAKVGSENPWMDNSVTVGVMTYSGTAGYEGVGSDPDHTPFNYEDKAHYTAGHISAWVGNFNFLGLYLTQKNDNPKGDGKSLDSKAWFIEADYVLYPWLVPTVRYESSTKGTADAVRMIIPGVSFLARANIRFFLEGQIRLDKAGDKEDKYIIGVNWGF